MIPDELVINKIYLVRGQKIMLDRDLAESWNVGKIIFSIKQREIFQQATRTPPFMSILGFTKLSAHAPHYSNIGLFSYSDRFRK